MLKIFKYLKRNEIIQIIFAAILIVGQVWLNLRLPDYMADITKYIESPNATMENVLTAGAWMLACALGASILAVLTGFIAARVATSFSKTLRAEVFDKTLSFSMAEINKFSTASLITRSTNDVTQIQSIFAMGLQVMVQAPILAVMAIFKISGRGVEWSIATGIAVFVVICLNIFLVTVAVPKFRIIQKLTDNLNRVIREHLTGVRVVHAYNAENYQGAKFEQANDEVMNTNLFVNRAMAILMPTITLLMQGLTLAIYLIGAQMIHNAALPSVDPSARITIFSNMVVFSSYAKQIIMAFMMMAMIFILIPRAMVSAKRVLEVLETPLSIVDGELKTSLVGHEGEIEFKNVSFKYPDAQDAVLENISFKANKGETVAFIGSTGSGKSTLIHLIPRFYDVTSGEVLVNGRDVREYKQEALLNKIGYVSQKAVLFSGTVASNVAYGSNGVEQLTQEGVKRAVAIAQGQDFVEKMEDQYEASIAQGGTNVSGGQKQRLSIARAVGRTPDIFIFDDSFSALDYKTDRVLRSVLKKETAGVTSLIVAQRIGTIKDADKIIVLDEGKMVGIGKHKELLQTCETYKEIAYSQLSKEELENE
ncbi:MAG: ABC transporter ATP-binding protein/permease [Streptococcaceae bacterium]|jgi:ATP-binding cassette subfamily B protein|nr:ABC transporter ATP-binding protein/permease [Streptococcaceae bacterium]